MLFYSKQAISNEWMNQSIKSKFFFDWLDQNHARCTTESLKRKTDRHKKSHHLEIIMSFNYKISWGMTNTYVWSILSIQGGWIIMLIVWLCLCCVVLCCVVRTNGPSGWGAGSNKSLIFDWQWQLAAVESMTLVEYRAIVGKSWVSELYIVWSKHR